ncbi:MAG: hypothetical protein PHF11_02340 [Candidatus Omnitrophica bacterium]|nr:hypothetical protein [Candidatus Omnitrophota bacterium]
MPKIFHLCLVFFLTFMTVGFFSMTQVDPHHDGIMLKPAVDVANGKMLFRDTFYQYGALTALVHASAIKLFGERLVVIRILTALFYGLISVLLWLIYSRILPKWLNTLSCVIWLLLGYFFINMPPMFILPWATVPAVFSILLSLYFLILFLEKQNYFLLFITGAAASLAFWFKINYGITSFLSIFLLLIILNIYNKKSIPKILLFFLSGYCFINAIFFIWLVAKGAISDFILQTLKFAFVFSNNNKFSSNNFFVIRMIKCLFPTVSVHGGTTILWTILPLVVTGMLAYTTFNFIKTKSISSRDRIILSVSFVAVGLWFGYYPINALFHIYLSSVLSIGLFTYLLWRMTMKIISVKSTIIFIVIFMILFLSYSILFYDIELKIDGGFGKISRMIRYEKILNPDFLSGIYVAKKDRQVYAEIEKLVEQFPGCSLINLTNSALYSLYKKNNKEFHKMYVNWGWNNSYLYPDYIPKLNKQISLKSSVILSNDNLMIEGYIPIAIFPELNEGDFAEKIIFLIPGEQKNAFTMSGFYIEEGRLSGKRSFRIKLRPELNGPVIINSIIVEIFSEHNIPKEINRYELDYNIIPRVFDERDRQFIKKAYRLDKSINRYSMSAGKDKNIDERLVNIFSNVFLCEKYFYTLDTFKESANNKIAIYLNGESVDYQERDPLNMRCSNNDAIDLIMRLAEIPKNYVIKLRINYNEVYYYEEAIKNC